MKKRIEKVVECVKKDNCITKGNFYNVLAETKYYYVVVGDDGEAIIHYKERFKVVTEREVLEFDNVEMFGKKNEI